MFLRRKQINYENMINLILSIHNKKITALKLVKISKIFQMEHVKIVFHYNKNRRSSSTNVSVIVGSQSSTLFQTDTSKPIFWRRLKG